MEELNPVYSIAIPTHVLSDLKISPTAKLLYGVIDSFQRKSGVCYATNERLAQELANCSDRTVSRCVAELKDAGFIVIEHAKGSAKKQPCRKIYLSVSDGQMADKIGDPPRQNCLPPLAKNGDIVNKESNKEKKKAIDLPPVFVEWISNAFPSAPAAVKNDLYQHLVAYAEMRKDSKSPLNTARKVSGLLEDLVDKSNGEIPVMCEMLTTAKRRCWLSVHAPKDIPRKTAPGVEGVMEI